MGVSLKGKRTLRIQLRGPGKTGSEGVETLPIEGSSTQCEIRRQGRAGL